MSHLVTLDSQKGLHIRGVTSVTESTLHHRPMMSLKVIERLEISLTVLVCHIVSLVIHFGRHLDSIKETSIKGLH